MDTFSGCKACLHGCHTALKRIDRCYYLHFIFLLYDFYVNLISVLSVPFKLASVFNHNKIKHGCIYYVYYIFSLFSHFFVINNMLKLNS